jgi:adenylate cyclase
MEAPDIERRLAAIVAADVEGYSRLMHRDEEATMSTLSARRAQIDNLIIEHRGRIANTAGDSVLAEFASVLDALSCAIEIQKAMDHANGPEPDSAMRFRIGINVGDVMVKEGDIFGDGVNVAARLESLAEGGGICVSRGVRDHMRHRANFVFEDLGEQLVKNIAHPIRAYRLRIGESAEERDEEQGEGSDILLPEETLSADNGVALELALWNSVKDGAPDELASYLEHYPEGTFASLARTRQHADADEAGDAQPIKPSDPESAPDPLDAAFWDAIKDSQTPKELAAYLERHPDGHFAVLAQARLSPVAEAAAVAVVPAIPTETIELAFWESVHDTEDPRLLRAYLEKFPDGSFAVIARTRLEEGARD